MTRVLLLMPRLPQPMGAPYLGQQYLAAALLGDGHEVRCLDLNAPRSPTARIPPQPRDPTEDPTLELDFFRYTPQVRRTIAACVRFKAEHNQATLAALRAAAPEPRRGETNEQDASAARRL